MEELLVMRTKDEAKSIRLLHSILATSDLFDLMAVRDLLECLRENEMASLLWEVVFVMIGIQSVPARCAKMEARKRLKLRLDPSNNLLNAKRRLRFKPFSTEEENEKDYHYYYTHNEDERFRRDRFSFRLEENT
jgi:hypothetical protein